MSLFQDLDAENTSEQNPRKKFNKSLPHIRSTITLLIYHLD